MANEARIAAVLKSARENLDTGRRYHDVICAMVGLSTSADESIVFEAIDGLIAVDVHRSTEAIFKNFHLFVAVLKAKGVVRESDMSSREQASKMAKEAFIDRRYCDVIHGLATVYNYDGDLPATDWAKVYLFMPNLIQEHSEMMTSSTNPIFRDLDLGSPISPVRDHNSRGGGTDNRRFTHPKHFGNRNRHTRLR
ncbi:unnamed protein product [Microthlaspi erraticum]|uniref:Uncharacterized protein n=1 Tax=Microthlaspi erraticum TaxID=1685480 RepID=A0A6D2L788_9BRAS|nr:unnamed protein product [Microthlaspi erraticum]